MTLPDYVRHNLLQTALFIGEKDIIFISLIAPHFISSDLITAARKQWRNNCGEYMLSGRNQQSGFSGSQIHFYIFNSIFIKPGFLEKEGIFHSSSKDLLKSNANSMKIKFHIIV